VLPAREVYTVSRLALEVRALLEGGFPLLWVEGEIANLTAARSGHVYFTLCDAHAQVRCVMWRSVARLLERPLASGDRVLVRARVGFYETRGEFQLDVQHVEPAGEGALLRAIEERRRRLAAEGLFDVARKRALPTLPRRLAVITSPHGAALHDVLTTLARRWPALEVTVLGVPVQGAAAPAAIVRALARAGAHGEVALVVRGGGALEDLMAFNDEGVVRAVTACAVPVVCGVGHEVDVTLADLAADRRAPTPTAAAEMVVPDRLEWLARLARCEGRLAGAARRRARMAAQRVDELERRLRHPAQRVAAARERLALGRRRLVRATHVGLAQRAGALERLELRLHGARPALRLMLARERLGRARRRLVPAWEAGAHRRERALASAGGRLHALSPLATLGRGYALATAAGGDVLRDAAQVEPGSAVSVRLARGRLGCTVQSQEVE
jgi:exodeoxyribonuclease VII large subunit